MLTLCLACALGVTGVRAQTFAPVPYHFAAAPESAPVFPSGSSEIVGSMAANGYGLWLSGYYGGYAYAWRLAGCGLKGTTPSGTVAFGSDDQGITPAPQDTKVATNLLGSVRYVCVNSTDDGFIISGIDDAQCGSKSDQISINFPYDQHNNLLSTPSDANIVGGNSGKEYVYPGVSTAVGDEWGQPPPPEKELEPVGDASGAGEHDPIDWDIAIDGHYLYIVWHHVETYPTDRSRALMKFSSLAWYLKTVQFQQDFQSLYTTGSTLIPEQALERSPRSRVTYATIVLALSPPNAKLPMWTTTRRSELGIFR